MSVLLSEDERALLNHVSMWGSDGYPVRKVGRGWTWGPWRSIRGLPAVVKTRREAVKSFERYHDSLVRRYGEERQAEWTSRRAAGWRPNPRSKAPAKRRAFQAQAYLFDRETFTIARARDWLKRNGHKYGGIREGDSHIRAEQHDASEYEKGTLHNISVAKHVQAVVGIPRSPSDASQARGYNRRGPRQGRFKFSSSSSSVGDTSDVIW